MNSLTGRRQSDPHPDLPPERGKECVQPSADRSLPPSAGEGQKGGCAFRTALATALLTALLLAGCGDSDDDGRATPTATPTTAVGRVGGTCKVPGSGSQGLGPCAPGTAVTVFSCDDRAACLSAFGGLRTAAALRVQRASSAMQVTTSVGADGTWSATLPSIADATIVAQAEVADGVSYRGLGSCSAGACSADIDLTPVSEAAVALLDSHGFENYSDAGASQVVAAVEAATAGLSFAGSTPAEAAALAESTASADPNVQLALQSAADTPTPTPPPPACCDCGDGCFQDTGSGCGSCTAVADAACGGSSCVAFTPTATASATGTATATATASVTATSPPACCDCGAGCFQDPGTGCGDCAAVVDAACTASGCAAFTATPSSSPTATRTATPVSTATTTATNTASPTHTPRPTDTATATHTASATGTVTLTPTPTGTATGTGTATATITATPTPTNVLPCVPATCTATAECDCDTHTSLYAIAHDYNDPLDTVLYRVAVGAWSTGTNWGDGTNGFFYLATVQVNASVTDTYTYVPFNGFAVDSDGDPALPAFSFIVPVDVSAGVDVTTLTITACASNQAGSLVTNDCGTQEYTPTCSETLWTDTYGPLTMPAVGEAPSALTVANLEFSGTSTVSIQNTGVYPGVLTLSPQTTLSSNDEAWLYNHLVFFDTNANPYTNDIFDDCSHRSIGVLTIDEAAYVVPGQASYRTKYGEQTAISSATSPDRQFFFYTLDSQATSAIDVGAQFIYDFSSECPGWINGGPGSIASTCNLLVAGESGTTAGLPNISPYAQVTPLDTAGVFSVAVSGAVQAGTQEIRSVSISSEQGVSLCECAMNPLAINLGASAYNPPNHVIDDSVGDWDSFPQGLSYVVPAGFGTCGTAAPFCERTTDYLAYIPHYADENGNFGTLNGGSTSEPTIGSFSLADEYAIGDIAASTTNTLQWFDNCGYGHSYIESGDTDPVLGTRKQLPSPPNDGKTYQYTIVNGLSSAIVFGKECCASYYQENQNVSPTAWEPPVQIDNSYGVFVAAGQTFTYETLFSDEAIVVYDAGTGSELFKLRLHPTSGAVYACSADQWSVGISGSNPYTVLIGAAGANSLACGSVGLCPYGTTVTQDGTSVTCTVTDSSFILGVEEWAAAVALETSAIQLQAWGAQGEFDGGGGFAMTVMPPSAFTESLYAYVGDANGASSILTTEPLSLVTADKAADTTDPATIGVLVIAGGGGSTGDGDNGGAGGSGGVAIANADPTGSAVSIAGGSGGAGGVNGGNGGNASGAGDGGSDGGTSGVGGFSSDTGWNDSGSLIPPQSWSPGSGPSGNSDCSNIGGKGGGGFGGGGHGGANCDGAGGGGGGGSWAAANTIYDITAPTSAPDSPGNDSGDDGAVAIAYTLFASCTATSSSVACVLPSLAYVADVEDVQSLAEAAAGVTLDDDTPMWIRAWGGQGGANDGTKSGGGQGLAQTLTTIDDFESTYGTQIYYYVGSLGDGSHEAGKGGSSTIVASADLSSVAACLPPTSSNCTQNILLVAGGGGGGGSDDAGGAGGQAIASLGQAATNGGASSDDAGGGAAGDGGSANGTGDGGSAGNDGIGGMGGAVHTSNGASTYTGWISTPSTVGTNGQGGEGKHDSDSGYLGGGGGGGWGGGGGGGAGGSEGHGGGGGGSYAIAATVSGSVPSGSPGTTNGAVEIGFLLTE